MSTRKMIRLLCSDADRALLQPLLDALREKGLRITEASGAKKDDIVLAALSETSMPTAGRPMRCCLWSGPARKTSCRSSWMTGRSRTRSKMPFMHAISFPPPGAKRGWSPSVLPPRSRSQSLLFHGF